MTGHTPRHAVVIASGGLDSTTAAYWLADRGSRLSLLSFDYGQRHRKELDFARRIAGHLGAHQEVVDLSGLGRLLSGSALTDPAVRLPDGHYTAESMRATVVPNRNAIMLDIAVGMAVARGADAVAFGAHAGDHAIYPDCRSSFFDLFAETAKAGNEGFLADGFEVLAPFIDLAKADIVEIGRQIGVPYQDTWSCYRGGEVHCGRCGTCTERIEAFSLAGVEDPTEYARAGAEAAR
ncbi:7-cyano-7-deazaguanine synthase QueC [Kitasatospora purpeofusca]|uniref:7-cyano-7-deazaguanine synthase QueC n=1 Tax=Kitasatospora purpeofusca TaxID=67352 RepID=UPI0022555D5C|nr:7-cyano-7-deazaguanine synthase QueC [Kitasatospora purpeofusca]MCX4758670.1 7-cyano-7-deazaguanine synthase QueC [Kitasatospora purpeofusca]WSR30895.1 7-cyano-7-deazaguanine synthase QueC [Kitasatospora purpeofusca]